MIAIPKQRERKQVSKLTLHDASCSPDPRFMQRLIELALPTAIAFLNAWAPSTRFETAALR